MIPKEEIEKSIPYKNPISQYQLGKSVGFVRGANWADKWHEKNNTVRQQQIEDKIRGMITEIDNNPLTNTGYLITGSPSFYFLEIYKYENQILQKLLDKIKEL